MRNSLAATREKRGWGPETSVRQAWLRPVLSASVASPWRQCLWIVDARAEDRQSRRYAFGQSTGDWDEAGIRIADVIGSVDKHLRQQYNRRIM